MTIIAHKQLANLRRIYKDKRIVLCTGTYDLIHAGHVLFFEECKKKGDILVVGVGSDKMIHKNKGNARPIIPQLVRIKMVDSLKPVDYCYIEKAKKQSQTVSAVDLAMGCLSPDIYIINSDAHYLDIRKKYAKKHGVKMLVLKRCAPKEYKNISSSEIIETILKIGK